MLTGQDRTMFLDIWHLLTYREEHVIDAFEQQILLVSPREMVDLIFIVRSQQLRDFIPCKANYINSTSTRSL